jgi:hypothetical protein
MRIRIGREDTEVRLLDGDPLTLDTPDGRLTVSGTDAVTLPTRRPDEAPTDNLARCREATATPSTPEPPQAAVDGLVASTWTAEQPGTQLLVDLGKPVQLGSIAITRPAVLAISNGKTDTDDHALTGPTRSAGEQIAVSADGESWQTVADIAAPGLRDDVAGAGQAVRFVRVTAGADATPLHPLVVGELAVER